MARVSLQNITKAFGGRQLFAGLSLEIHTGMRLAVAGPNGCGKSTLLRILAGREDMDSGQIHIAAQAQTGYSRQELGSMDLATGVLAWVLECLPSWSEFWTQWDKAVQNKDTKALEQLATQQAQLEQQLGYNPEHRAQAVLTGLGFSTQEMKQPLSSLSGGWRERAKLARILVQGADILLLDEPTNHLDLEAVEWLEDYLQHFSGTLIFVAHDRVLLDTVANHILFLGGSKPVVRKGTFSAFVTWLEETEEQRRRAEQKVHDDIAKKRDFVRRFQAKASKARQANSMKKQVAKLERELEGLRPEGKAKELSFRWPVPEPGNKTVLSAQQVSYAWATTGDTLWKPLSFHIYAGQKIALAGPNGCGKTTLLTLLTGTRTPDRGTIETGSKMQIGYFSQHQTDSLQLTKTVLQEIRRLSDPRTTEQELYSVLGLFLLPESFWERPVGSLSGGEKNKLVLASLFLQRANFLVLDEPTNHLDLESREALVCALQEYTGTLLMVAHDRALMQAVAQEVWWLRPEGIAVFPEGFASYDKARKAVLNEAQKQSPAKQAEKIKKACGLSRAEQKEQKRQQAQTRNARYKKLQPKKKACLALEQALDAALTETQTIEQSLADPAVYADVASSQELLKRFATLQQQSEQMLEELDTLQAEILRLETDD